MTKPGQADELSEGKQCLVPACEKPAKWKGLCRQCYGNAKKLIDAEEIDWDDLQSLGLALLPGQQFLVEFRKRKESKAAITYPLPSDTIPMEKQA